MRLLTCPGTSHLLLDPSDHSSVKNCREINANDEDSSTPLHLDDLSEEDSTSNHSHVSESVVDTLPTLNTVEVLSLADLAKHVESTSHVEYEVVFLDTSTISSDHDSMLGNIVDSKQAVAMMTLENVG